MSLPASPLWLGPLCAVGAVMCFAVNDVVMKGFSDTHPLHQVVLFRALFGIAIVLLVIVPLTSGYRSLRTKRLPMHLLRGGCVVFANTTFFLGLAALPLADTVAIFFVAPLVITVFSVLFLGETVGPRRWTAIGIGLLGVIVMMRPGTSAFQWAALLPLAAAFGYAGLHIIARKIGGTESAASMSFYLQFVFLVISLSMGLLVGHGRFADGLDDPSLTFLLRPWFWSAPMDYVFYAMLGTATAFGGYMISKAYAISEASLIAPTEYLALPISVVAGIIIFGEYPDGIAVVGIALILGAGLYMVWRERIAMRK